VEAAALALLRHSGSPQKMAHMFSLPAAVKVNSMRQSSRSAKKTTTMSQVSASFLASDNSSYVTGIELFVDGGMAQI
jgi:enoyl-[acyl-carrier-protein] reductase (NADH)